MTDLCEKTALNGKKELSNFQLLSMVVDFNDDMERKTAQQQLSRITDTDLLILFIEQWPQRASRVLVPIQKLLARKLDPNTCDEKGLSPVHVACIMGSIEVLNMLVNCGADLNKSTQKSPVMTPLHIAVFNGNEDLTSYLLAHGAQTEREDILGTTPLALAIQKNHPGAALALLVAGASTTPPIHLRESLLSFAVRMKYRDCCAILLTYLKGGAFKQFNTSLAETMDIFHTTPKSIRKLLTRSIAGKPITCCAYCFNSEAASQCGTCHRVQYCDTYCQKNHWRTHKMSCKKLKDTQDR